MHDSIYPTRPKAGYCTYPDFDSIILKMTKEELRAVEEFQIENQHGSILFLGQTDLVDVDLAKDVTIKPRNIEVYPNDDSKPDIGSKLNKGALVTLEGGMKPKRGLNAAEYE